MKLVCPCLLLMNKNLQSCLSINIFLILNLLLQVQIIEDYSTLYPNTFLHTKRSVLYVRNAQTVRLKLTPLQTGLV